jgi:hypothetical protein
MRSIVIILAFVLGILAARRAHASEQTHTCSGDVIPLAGALLTPRLDKVHDDGKTLAWDVRFIVDVDAAWDFRGGWVPFAAPLLAGESLAPQPGVTPIIEADRLVGICASPEAIHDRTIAVSFVAPRAGGSFSAFVPLGAPIAAGNAVQIVDPMTRTEQRLEIHAGGLLESHVGYVAPRGIGRAARDEARRLTETRPRVGTSLVYVRGDDVRDAGELTGRIAGASARSKSTAVAIGLLFAALVSGLLLLLRKLADGARVERADALLASEFDRLDRTDTSPLRGQWQGSARRQN